MSRSPFCIIVLAVLTVVATRGRLAADDAEPSRLAEALSKGDAGARLGTLSQIARFGHLAIPIVPHVARRLSDADPRVRAAAAKLLRQIGPDASAASGALLARLDDPDRRVRVEAARALGRIPAEPSRLTRLVIDAARKDPEGLSDVAVDLLADVGTEVVPTAQALLAEKDTALILLGIKVLQRIGPAAAPAVGSLTEVGRRPERVVREQAAWALARCGPAALAPLTAALRDRDPRVRGVAARGLELMAFRAAEAIPALIDALGDPVPPDDPRPPPVDGFEEDPDFPLPRGCQAALAAIGPPALRVLVARLESNEPRERLPAMEAIGAFGPAGRGAVPALGHLLVKPGTRVEAAATLGRIGFPARAVVPRLIPAAKNRDPMLRRRALLALGQMASGTEPPGEAHRQAMLGALADADARVRLAAVRALNHVSLIPPKELLPLLTDPDSEVRRAAVQALRAGRNEDASMVRQMQDRGDDPDRRVRKAAVVAWLWGPRPELRDMLARLDSVEPEIRGEVASRLAQIEPFELPCFPPYQPTRGDLPASLFSRVNGAGDALRARLQDPNRRVRTGVVYALSALPNEAAVTVPMLIDRLGDPAPLVRLAAATVLGRLGPAARDAVPALLAHVDDVGDGSDLMLTLPRHATSSIAAIRPEEASRAYARLIDLLVDPRPHVRRAAQWAVNSHLRPMMGMLLAVLEDPQAVPSRRRGVARFFAYSDGLLEQDGSTPIRDLRTDRLLPALREIVFDLDEEDDERRQALARVRELTTQPEASTRLVLDAFGRARIRLPDLSSLLNPRRALSLATLDEGLRDPDPAVRTIAAYLVGVPAEQAPGGDERRRVGDDLIALLDDPDPQVRWAAALSISLRNIEPEQAHRAIDRLRAVLRDGTTRLRPGSWYFTIQDLAERLPDEIRIAGRADSPKLRCVAATALYEFWELGEVTSSIPELLAALKDGDPLARLSAVHTLGAFEGKAQPAVAALNGCLAEPGDFMGCPNEEGEPTEEFDGGLIRKWSAWALGEIGEPARSAVPSLIRTMDDPNPVVREAAAEALGKLAPFNVAAPTALTRALHDRFDPRRLEAAVTALAGAGSAGIAVLVGELRSDDPETCVLAANALLQATDEAATVLPALRIAADSEDFALREAADRAIKQLKDEEKPGGPRNDDEDRLKEEPR
ncbi:putative lyase [Aquisphaera giovannonii]|uniref:Putative lyase n=1 Tax=Aquisphaera giovannonii TaxID=406548 RepID=A0A5B9W935_9BACT|nr:HEAT repeat domain-containing protein [Aquisphaera giovannonii]QEH37033.1 putative lyase [Aquisphaera giovannonii]